MPVFKNLEVLKGRRDGGAWQELVDASLEISKELDNLLAIAKIQAAYFQGRFDQCLIRKEARELLHPGYFENHPDHFS